MQEKLEHNNKLLESDLNNNQIDSFEHELRDLCIQLELQIDYDPSLSQSETIYAMLQSIKFSLTGNTLDKSLDPFNDSREHQKAVCEFLSEIDEAQERVLDISQKLECETICRKTSEIQCVASEEALASAKEKITTLEQVIKDMGEQVKCLESNLESAQDQKRCLEQCIREKDSSAQKIAKDAKDIETHLHQAKYQHQKSELKYERASSEIESCQKLAIELKTILIEKVSTFIICHGLLSVFHVFLMETITC